MATTTGYIVFTTTSINGNVSKMYLPTVTYAYYTVTCCGMQTSAGIVQPCWGEMLTWE